MAETKYRVVLWLQGEKVEEVTVSAATPKSAVLRSAIAKHHPEIYRTWRYADSPDGSAGFVDPADVASFVDVQPDFRDDPDYATIEAVPTPGPTSLLAIDVGFDPRATRTLIRLDNWRHGVRYHPEPESCMGQAECHARDVETMAETLAKAGYSVAIVQTPNGRDVQCTPQDRAPAGDRPDYDWTGPAWAVQARTDNYWCIGPSLLAAIDRAGWRPDELTDLSGDSVPRNGGAA
jgi:hypothetical protein